MCNGIFVKSLTSFIESINNVTMMVLYFLCWYFNHDKIYFICFHLPVSVYTLCICVKEKSTRVTISILWGGVWVLGSGLCVVLDWKYLPHKLSLQIHFRLFHFFCSSSSCCCWSFRTHQQQNNWQRWVLELTG